MFVLPFGVVSRLCAMTGYSWISILYYFGVKENKQNSWISILYYFGVKENKQNVTKVAIFVYNGGKPTNTFAFIGE